MVLTGLSADPVWKRNFPRTELKVAARAENAPVNRVDR